MKNNFCSKLIITFFTLILLSSCSNQYSKLSRFDNKCDKYQGHFKYASNTTDKNRSLDNYKGFSQTGIASWYGTKKAFHNKITANGDKFNKDCLTVAHRTLPIPSLRIRPMHSTALVTSRASSLTTRRYKMTLCRTICPSSGQLRW